MKNIMYLLFTILLFSCFQPKQKENEEIKQTVYKILKSVENNDIESYKNLIHEHDKYIGALTSEFFYFNKNFKKFNSQIKFYDNIIVKDSAYSTLGLEFKVKYVKYEYKLSENLNKRPIVFFFEFSDQYGYNKIDNPSVLDNYIGVEIE